MARCALPGLRPTPLTFTLTTRTLNPFTLTTRTLNPLTLTTRTLNPLALTTRTLNPLTLTTRTLSSMCLPSLLTILALTLLLPPGLSASPPSASPEPEPGCDLVGEAGAESRAESGLLSRLEPLRGRSFNVTTTDPMTKDSYTYTFRVCASVPNIPGAGLVQYDDKSKQSKIIGRINSTQLIGGTDWIILIYGSGDPYATHCNHEDRKGMVMISCAPGVLGASFTSVIEERTKMMDCFYLFELDSQTACPSPTHRLSTGSILLIIFVVLLTVYILGGFLYQRLVIRAKGVEQFPNYYFWQEVGNLTADGCDSVFRSKPRVAVAAYRGVGDEPVGEEEEEERDEHLLPM